MIEALLASLAEAGRRVPLFADFSDDYAAMGRMVGEPFFEEYQRALGRICTLTVPCQALADRLAGVAEKGIRVIEDPWESPRANPPRFAPGTPLRLCWFGTLGDVNVSLVETGLLQVAARATGTPIVLDVVAGAERRDLVQRLGARLLDRSRAFTTRFVPWSLEATWRAIDECDLVLLPQDVGGEWGSVKSHNRMVETIRGGRLAIASPIPSYQELADYAWLGEDLGEGVAWARENPEAARARVAAGQAYIAGRFSPEMVGRKWARGSRRRRRRATTRTEIEMSDAGEAYLRWFYDTGVWKRMHYRGARVLKSPSDLWNYQEIITELDVQWIVETGTRHGGSALYFADLLRARDARGKVITVDVDPAACQIADHAKIEFVYGSSVDPGVVAVVRSMLPADRGCVFMILDSDHSRDHVLQELRAYVPLLAPGDYLVVEDTCVNGHPVRADFGPGPWEAVEAFVAEQPGVLRNDVERERKFGFTVAPRGFFIKT